jgi:hypothetical protein
MILSSGHWHQLRARAFSGEWIPVRAWKTRQIKEIEPALRFDRNAKGSSPVPQLCGLLGAAIEVWGLRRVHSNGHIAELLFTFGLAPAVRQEWPEV